MLNLIFGYMTFETISTLFSNGNDSYIKIFLEALDYLTKNDLQTAFLTSSLYNNYHNISLIVFEIIILLIAISQCQLIKRKDDINLQTISLDTDEF